MYQDILAALFKGTVTMDGLRDLVEVYAGMERLGINLNAPSAEVEKLPVPSKEAVDAANVVEGHCRVDAGTLPGVLEAFKQKNKEMGKTIGNKIQLIKMLREQLGLGLADAKHVTERLFGI